VDLARLRGATQQPLDPRQQLEKAEGLGDVVVRPEAEALLERRELADGSRRLNRARRRINDQHLVIKALDMALRRRCPGDGLMHHSDQGSP
jgi:hypothetical protein